MKVNVARTVQNSNNLESVISARFKSPHILWFHSLGLLISLDLIISSPAPCFIRSHLVSLTGANAPFSLSTWSWRSRRARRGVCWGSWWGRLMMITLGNPLVSRPFLLLTMIPSIRFVVTLTYVFDKPVCVKLYFGRGEWRRWRPESKEWMQLVTRLQSQSSLPTDGLASRGIYPFASLAPSQLLSLISSRIRDEILRTELAVSLAPCITSSPG